MQLEDLLDQNGNLPAEPDIVDGFTYSMSIPLLPTSYRTQALAQMEPLRRAAGYTARWYTAPDTLDVPIPANSQAKYQLSITPGSYIWGISIFFSGVGAGDLVHVLVSDACSELQFYSDYTMAKTQAMSGSKVGPQLLPQPRLISNPGLVNVEIYVAAVAAGSQTETVQVVLFTAEPCAELFNKGGN